MWIVFATACGVAVPFYLRFLVALCQECRVSRICYLIRIVPSAIQEVAVEPKQRVMMSERAA